MITKLIEKIKQKKAPVCVGLDPMPSFIPEHIKIQSYDEFGAGLKGAAQAVLRFNKEIIDNIYDLIPAVKPQAAMYEQLGPEGMKVYAETIEYCHKKGLIVIGDVKRGDIGSTCEAYATGHIGEIEIGSMTYSGFDTDMITVNPYTGSDGIIPFLNACNKYDKGIFVLVKTSNPSSGEFQDIEAGGRALYEYVGKKVAEWGSLSMDGYYSNVGAVVGATFPEVIKKLRKLMPYTYFLVPGYGAQGAGAAELKYCFNDDGLGAIINSSRGIIAAYKSEKYKNKFSSREFPEASRLAVSDMIKDISSAAGRGD